jgi:hypothetical protein
MVDLIDPTGLAPSGLTLSEAALFVLSKMDGHHSHIDIQAEFMRRHGHLLFTDELDTMVQQLDQALFLEGPRFESHLAERISEYRRSAFRPLRDKDALGAPGERLGAYLDSMLAGTAGGVPEPAGKLIGLVVPHLDYARGGPCYAAAYRHLAQRTEARRFVVLGTNHFGLARAVVGTRKDFETPFGLVPHDDEFMQRMEARCGAELCEGEYDHLREHSIELQVVLLKHLLPDRPFTIAPYLCPDPCGSAGTAPAEGQGVDLKKFAAALGDELVSDDVPTCLIAAADLSHVGRYFHDHQQLDRAGLRDLEAADRRLIEHFLRHDAESFRAYVSDAKNPTNVCSVGCLYTLATVLASSARPRLLHYHQAVTHEVHNCVTCAAIEFTAV